jgi:hypothetical protein
MLKKILKGVTRMKTLSLFLALVNSLLAGLLITFSLSSGEIRQAESWWLLTKLLAGFSVIFVGILTWVESITPLKPNLVALASLYLVTLGAVTVVWTFHLALLRGDLEYYMILYGGSLFVQGIALLFGVKQDTGKISTV